MKRPPSERGTVKVYPSTRNGAFVGRAAFHERNTGRHVDDWTAAFRGTPMPRALLPGRKVTFELAHTIVHRPKVDVGGHKSIVGARLLFPSSDGWPADGQILAAADGTRGLEVYSRQPNHAPQSFRPTWCGRPR